MSVEFIVRDELGRTQLDLSRSTTKFVGELTVTASGSQYIPELEGRRVWWLFVPYGWAPLSIWAGRAWVVGATLNWQLTRGTYKLRYGVY